MAGRILRTALKSGATGETALRLRTPIRTVTAVDPSRRVYPVGKVAVLIASLRREGIPLSRALSGVHLAERDLHAPATRVSINEIIRICRNALALSRDPHFPFHAGMRVHLSAYGMYGFAILSSTSIREAIEFALRYHLLAVPLVDVSVREERGQVIWSLHPIDAISIDGTLKRFVLEFEQAILLSLHRDCIGGSLTPLRVSLPFSAPGDARICARMFGCPVLFDQDDASLIFDARSLDGELKFGNETAHAEMVKLCDGLMEEFRLRSGIAGQVRETLLVNRMATMSIGEVANRLHMTERTLRRRLEDENTSFRQIVADIRMRVAMKYLRDTDLSIAEIAQSVGFSEDGSFRHAFQRSSRVSPRQFRKQSRRRMKLQTVSI